MPDLVNVIVRRGKCYTCMLAQTEAGFYLDSEPVFVTDLDVDELLAALEKVIVLGHPKIPTPSPEEMRKQIGPIPSAVGVNSWKKLAQRGAAYSIQWNLDESITLFISRLDKKGRFEWDPAKTRTFAKDTALHIIVEEILKDARSRPDLMG